MKRLTAAAAIEEASRFAMRAGRNGERLAVLVFIRERMVSRDACGAVREFLETLVADIEEGAHAHAR